MVLASTIVFRGAWLVTQDDSRRVFRGDLLLKGDRIQAVDEHIPEKADREIDARKFAIVPGFVNAHTHVANALLRGVADERDFAGFLDTMFTWDARRTPADLEAGAYLGIAEMLLGGSTSFLDMYYGEDLVAGAARRMGMRAFLGWAVLDPEITTQKGVPVENAREFIHRWAGDPLVTPLVAPQGVYACREETWHKARELAEREGTLLHYHLSETREEVEGNRERTGLRPVEWLDRIGFLGERQVAAHAVWLTNHEIDLLSRRHVATVHCPASNMKLASGGGGVAPVPEMRAAGIPVALGTDSSTSNNGTSLLREMHLAALAQKHHRHDARSLPAQVVLDMATREGARALHREPDLGRIAPGSLADLVLFDLTHPSLVPSRPESLVSHIVYSATESAIHSVYVAGEPVVQEGRILRVSRDEITEKAQQAAHDLFGREGSKEPSGSSP